jgi:putative FmdB family regulatory protein
MYEYLCEECGPFAEVRPMAEYDRPLDCPHCGSTAPRVILTAPNFSGLSGERRLAHAVNERSAHSPTHSADRKKAHGAGCGCCSGKKSTAKKGKNGAKSFPSKRPWMISH